MIAILSANALNAAPYTVQRFTTSSYPPYENLDLFSIGAINEDAIWLGAEQVPPELSPTGDWVWGVIFGYGGQSLYNGIPSVGADLTDGSYQPTIVGTLNINPGMFNANNKAFISARKELEDWVLYDIGTLEGFWGSEGLAINNDELMVGFAIGGSLPGTNACQSIIDLDFGKRAYIFDGWNFLWGRDGQPPNPNEELEDLGTLGGPTSKALDINDAGIVVGTAQDATLVTRSFIWSRADGMIDLGVGTVERPCSAANAINQAGVIVGEYQGLSFLINPSRAYIKKSGIITDLGELFVAEPGYDGTRAFAINQHNEVVGKSNSHAFVWRDDVITDLNDLIPPAMGWVLKTAVDINGSGFIVGEGTVDGEKASFLLRPTDIHIVSGDGGWRSWPIEQHGWNDRNFSFEPFWPLARAPYPNPNQPTDLIPGTDAQHMWHDPKGISDGTMGVSPAYFRYKFHYHFASADLTLDAVAQIAVDDDYEFYVNGQLVFVNDDGFAGPVDSVDFAAYLVEGENVLAIKAVDSAGNYESVLFDAQITMSHLLEGDLNGDACTDRDDLSLMLTEVRSPTPRDTRYDLNKDGLVNIADARYLVTKFTNPRGVACP